MADVYLDEMCVQYGGKLQFYDSFKLTKLSNKNRINKMKLHECQDKLVAFNKEKLYVCNFSLLKIISRYDGRILNSIKMYSILNLTINKYIFISRVDFNICLLNNNLMLLFDPDGYLLFKNSKMNDKILNFLLESDRQCQNFK